MGSGRTDRHVSVTVGSWVVGGTNTRTALRESFAQALADMGLVGTVE